MNEDQIMEWEVLDSIYSVDELYKKVSDNRLHYKFGTDTDKTFLLELEWPADYPAVPLLINMDVFYNSHISVRVRECIKQKILEVATEYEGMAASFSIIEYVKENLEELTSDWELATAEAIGEVRTEEVKEKRDEPMTKAAKRRMWTRNEGTGQLRGSDWVDIISHLSQTKDN